MGLRAYASMLAVAQLALVGSAVLAGCSQDERSGAPTAGTVNHPEPYGSEKEAPPPAFNRWVNPGTGQFWVPDSDDRELGTQTKEQYPLLDPRWKPFVECMRDRGFDLGAPADFRRRDLDALLEGITAEVGVDQAKQLNTGDALPGRPGAFLACADQWLAIPVADFPKYGFVVEWPTIPKE